MRYESLAPELKAWLKQSVEQGCDPRAIEQAMCAAGHPKKFARRAVQLACEQFGPTEAPSPPAVPETDAASAMPSAHAILSESSNAIETIDRQVDILFALNAPRIILFGNFLSHEECDELRALAEPKLSRSTVVDAQSGSFEVHPARTSRGGHFLRGENELIRRIEARIADLLGCPEENGEPIQILHYLPGAEYKAHFDYFDPNMPGAQKVLATGGQRVATLIMYLNDVISGGSTVFPEVGMDVLPKKGHAVFFAYATEDGQVDPRTLHGGSPVREGEKWIATKWIRQRRYGA